MMPVAGFVLAGGRSSRMRQNKARLRMGNRFLVEVVAHEVKLAAGSVALIGPPADFNDLDLLCLPDERPDCGPLGGLEAALASGRGEWNVVASCDLPDLQSAHLLNLLAAAQASRALCVLAKDAGGRRHPLCALYRSQALPAVRRALDAGRLRMMELVEELKAEEVPIHAVLHNLNTPEEWVAWQAAQQPV